MTCKCGVVLTQGEIDSSKELELPQPRCYACQQEVESYLEWYKSSKSNKKPKQE